MAKNRGISSELPGQSTLIQMLQDYMGLIDNLKIANQVEQVY